MLLLLIYFIDIVWIEVNIQIALCRHAAVDWKIAAAKSLEFSLPIHIFLPPDNYLKFCVNIQREGETNV